MIDTQQLTNSMEQEISSDGLKGEQEVSLETSEGMHSIQTQGSDTSGISTCTSHQGEPEEEEFKCSAVHSLERDMPDFDYSDLIAQFRKRILDHCGQNPGLYGEEDIEKCRTDDWHLSRFLLRQKMDLEAAFEMICRAMRFRHEHLCATLKPQDFPAEFYNIGGLYSMGEDRKGNKVLHMRVKVHKKMPELQTILDGFIFYNIDKIDREAGGKGIVLLLDCTDAGISNADVDTLMFLITSLKSYFPKGLSYMLVHNMPWILKPIWALARIAIPEEYRQLVKFSNSNTIFEYINRNQLPDYMGGTNEKDYRAAPENCTTLFQAAKLWGLNLATVRQVLLRFMSNLPEEALIKFDKNVAELKSKTDDDNEEGTTKAN